MDDRIVFRFSIWPSTPEDKRDHIINIQVHDSNYYALLQEWARQHKDDLDNLRGTWEPYSIGSEQAKKFYWKCVDTLAVGIGENTESHRKSLHKHLKEDCNIRTEEGELKSLTKMDTKEIWRMTERCLDWCEESQIDVRHLRGEQYGQSKQTEEEND